MLARDEDCRDAHLQRAEAGSYRTGVAGVCKRHVRIAEADVRQIAVACIRDLQERVLEFVEADLVAKQREAALDVVLLVVPIEVARNQGYSPEHVVAER